MNSIIFTSVTNYQKPDKLENNNIKRKSFKEIPIISHKSEKPSISFEEINGIKMNSIIVTSDKNYQKHDKLENKKIKSKKYKQIPIIEHKSEKPSISFEEINGRKMNSIIFTSFTNYQKPDKLESKNIKHKIYKEIPIIIHNSEKPSISFEQINGGKMNSFSFSITNYQKKLDDKIVNKNIKNKIYNKIPIIIHNSEKPSILYEEINGVKMNSFISTSITNYQKHLDDKLENKNFKIKKYKETPIISHKSENPSISYEENNSIIITTIIKYQKD